MQFAKGGEGRCAAAREAWDAGAMAGIPRDMCSTYITTAGSKTAWPQRRQSVPAAMVCATLSGIHARGKAQFGGVHLGLTKPWYQPSFSVSRAVRSKRQCAPRTRGGQPAGQSSACQESRQPRRQCQTQHPEALMLVLAPALAADALRREARAAGRRAASYKLLDQSA
eukprot:scaffold10540_cov116-Isochrysis_galbana.AAC.16